MATDYPGALDAFTNPTSADTLDNPSHADQHANINDAMEAVQAELGTDPAGSFSTVKARVASLEQPSCLIAVRATSDQSINNNTLTTVVFNSILDEDDEDGDFSLNTSTGVLTINTTGWYCFQAGVIWDTNSTGERLLRVLRDGSSDIISIRHTALNNAVATLGKIMKLTATDTIEVNVRQTSGGALAVLNSERTFMSIHRIR